MLVTCYLLEIGRLRAHEEIDARGRCDIWNIVFAIECRSILVGAIIVDYSAL